VAPENLGAWHLAVWVRAYELYSRTYGVNIQRNLRAEFKCSTSISVHNIENPLLDFYKVSDPNILTCISPYKVIILSDKSHYASLKTMS